MDQHQLYGLSALKISGAILLRKGREREDAGGLDAYALRVIPASALHGFVSVNRHQAWDALDAYV